MVAETRNGKTTVYGKHGALRVEGTHLVNKNGEPVQLRGVSTHNVNSFPQFVNNDAIEYMADNWNMELYRYAMYSAFADGDAGYADGTDEHRAELEKMCIESVKKCAELGIYCMVDWHILFDYNPNMHKDMAIKFFANVSEALKDFDNVIYEICNEPNEDCTWEEIKSYAEEVIPVIRANDPDSVIVCGTPKWSQCVDEAADNPLEFDNVLYALHFYATTHKQWLRDKADYAMSKGCAIYVTEFGICDASGNGEIDYEETDRWFAYLNKHSISYSIWNLSNKDESSAMIAPTCDKVTGWTEDELSESGKWFVGMNK
ncbi:MAG: glycoside hydrolase family 5 protein [Lachnospiraceae bacterium]|nr:glycoside hydrolase family 5 protein [Lachnospiraceae bacterium]